MVTSVAPAYPRVARQAGMQGNTITELSVNQKGVVTEAKRILGHPIFEQYVLAALRQWRLKPSGRDYTFQVTCRFELTDDECEGTAERPATETQVSAELPALIRVTTSRRCIEMDTSQRKR